MSYIGSELRQLRRELARVNRQLAQQRMPGKVAERNESTRKVRLELGEDPETGRKILSPWVRVPGLAAGAMKVSLPLPSIGEQMYLESPSGIVGADSLATPGAFDDDNPRPQHDPDELVMESGGMRLALKPDRVRMALADQGYELKPDGLRMLGKLIHKGGTKPAVGRGDKDSAGHTLQGGNEDVLV